MAMRHACFCLLFTALLSASEPLGLSTPDREGDSLDRRITSDFRIPDVRTLDPCDIGAAVAQIARQTGTPTGFENASDCWLSRRVAEPSDTDEVMTGMTPREALDHLMSRLAAYAWRDMHGVAVVRPKAAWVDSANVLNRQVRAFTATDLPPDSILHIVLQATTPVAFIPHEDAPRPNSISRPVTVTFSGGTMLEAMNALVRARRDVEWQIGYAAGRATIVLSTFGIDGGVAMAPVALPQRQSP
jgi:hypothetical protein